MRRISRMLLVLQAWSLVWNLAASEGAAQAAESPVEPAAEAVAAAEWSAADAELAVLAYLVAAQRADARASYAEAVARLHADAAVLARFGLAPPDEARQLDEQRASAILERDAAGEAKAAARGQLAERLVSAASLSLSELAAAVRTAGGGEAAHGNGAGGDEAASGETAGGDGAAAETGGPSGGPAAVAAEAEEGGGADAAGEAVPYPEAPIAAERAMRQACRQIETESLLVKTGLGSVARLAEAHAGCLQAELVWIDAQAESFSALLTGASASGRGPVTLPALLDMVRDRQPALYDRWIRHLMADAACPSGAPPGTAASMPVHVSGADGLEAETLSGCAVGLPGVELAGPQPAIRSGDGAVWLPLRPYAAALGMQLEWHADARRITLAAGEMRLAMAPGSAAIEWDGGSYVMARSVLTVNGQSFVPAEFFPELFALNLYWDDNVRAGWLLPASV